MGGNEMKIADRIDYKRSQEILDGFGSLVYEVFDETLDTLKDALTSDQLPAFRALRELLDEMPPTEKTMTAAQYALETFIHDLMAAFQESNSYAAVAKIGSEGVANIRNLAEVGLEFEQVDWQERHSKYSSITQQIV